jgi:hypothetical protein
MGNSMPEPAPQTWLEKELKSWKSIIGVVVVLVILSDIRGCIFPDHPAPVALEADGKSYVSCNTPDISRGLFHLSSTYSVDFEDNNGSTISLRGVEKLIVTNLPKEEDAPMPSPSTDDLSNKDSDGKTLVEGRIYNWDDGTEARWAGGKWQPVKIKNRVCESDAARDKRLAQEEERRQAHQKRIAEAAAAKLAQTCKEWEQKHPLGSPVDVFTIDNSTDKAVIGTPEGCEGSLETAYKEKMEQEQAKDHAAQEVAKQRVVSKPVSGHRHWATATSPYSRTIYKRCHFDVNSSASCGYANEEVAQLNKGDRVEILSGKIRSASGTEICEVKFQSWVGWMDATDLTFDIE